MCINPLLLAIGPIVLSIYAMLREEKRLKAKYGIKDVRVLSSSAPLFSAPQRVKVESQIEKLLEEYEQTLKKKREKLRE